MRDAKREALEQRAATWATDHLRDLRGGEAHEVIKRAYLAGATDGAAPACAKCFGPALQPMAATNVVYDLDGDYVDEHWLTVCRDCYDKIGPWVRGHVVMEPR